MNVLANRSFNDFAQYPVFPWVVQEFSSPEFEPGDPKFYRDLSKPIGAVNQHRLRRLKDLREVARERKMPHHDFLYQTFYSNPSIVSYYLIRSHPELNCKREGDFFSQSDRVFRSVELAFYVAMNHTNDFKELTPEFYGSDPSFLVKHEAIDLGFSPEMEPIEDVILP